MEVESGETETARDEATVNEATEDGEESEQLVTKRNTSAPVWKHFGFEADEGGKPRNVCRPQCRVCHQEVGAKDGNTSNLYSHLKNKHPELYTEVCKSKSKPKRPTSQPSLSEVFQKVQPLSTSSREHAELTRAVAYCLAKDMLPISTVEKAGFKAMIQRFYPRYQLQSRSYFSRVAIPAMVEEVKREIDLQIRSKELSFFSGTTDLWTSAAGDPYFTYTCHYINSQWEMQSVCLQTHYIPQDHTGENIKEALSATLQQWNLDQSNQVGITTDSGSNVKSACELLSWTRLSCFGHNLNLAVEKGLADGRVKRVLGLCKSIVAAFSRSWKKQRELGVVQEQKQLPTHKLKADVVTRWGSSYEMVERLIEQMEAIRVVLASDRKSAHLIPSWQDCDVLDSIVGALKPLKEMTDVLSGEKGVTVSAVKPIVHYITTEVLVAKDEDTGLTKEMKERMKVDLELRYSDSCLDQLLSLASFLDPRFKLGYVGDQESVLEEVKQQLSQLVAESETDSATAAAPENGPPASKKAKGLSKILGKRLPGTTTLVGLTPQEKIQQELDCYLAHPILEMEEDPLIWWKVEHLRYPHLAKLAQKYLCLCATSVPAERIFSIAGQIVSDRRSALKPGRVDQLVFLARNLK